MGEERKYVPLSQTYQTFLKEGTNRHIFFTTPLARGIEDGTG